MIDFELDKERLINLGRIGEAGAIALIKEAYKLSIPMGLGYLHFKEGELSDQEAKEQIIDNGTTYASLDYVNGRCVKLPIYKNYETNEVFISNNWFDHTEEQLKQLVASVEPYKCEEIPPNIFKKVVNVLRDLI